MRFFIVLTLFVLASFPALAQPREVRQCGRALSTDMNTRPAYNYCDIYSRQIAYGNNRADFREQIDQRRNDYAVPRQQAIEAYHEWEASRYDSAKQNSGSESRSGSDPGYDDSEMK